MLVQNKIKKEIEQGNYIELEKDFKNHFNLITKYDLDMFINKINNNKIDLSKFINISNEYKEESLHTIIALSKIK